MANFEFGPQYLHVVIALGILATITVVLRLISRWIAKRSLGSDDCWVLAGFVFMFGLVVNSGYLYIAGGMGRDFLIVATPSQRDVFFQAFFASELLYYFTMTAIKISILCLYRRLFPLRNFRLTTVIVGLICIAWFIGGTISTVLQCRPIAAAWNRSIPGKHCINMKAMFEGIVAINLITDVIILCLPMKLVWNLHLQLRQKLVVLAIFALGGLACIICLLRLAVFVRDQYDPDLSFVLLQCSLWTIIEPELAVIAANLPTLRPLLPKRASVVQLTNRLSAGPSSPTRKSWYRLSSLPSANVAQIAVSHTIEYPLKGYQEIRDLCRNGGTSRVERGSREIYTGPADPGIHVREEITIV